jgi:hypothetical protein
VTTPEQLAHDLAFALKDIEPVESVRAGTRGDQTPVLIVTLKRKPPSCFDPTLRKYKGLEVLWKVTGNVEAL